jgi:TolA-binding protein
MGEQPGKAAKAHVYGTPLIALIMAVAGYLSNKSDSQDAKRKADREADEAVVTADMRLRRAYDELAEYVEAENHSHAQRLDDLESWVVELEEFIEDHVEEDSPRTAREREAREARLAEIREKKARRQRKAEFKAARPEPAALPAYDVVQETAPPLPVKR